MQREDDDEERGGWGRRRGGGRSGFSITNFNTDFNRDRMIHLMSLTVPDLSGIGAYLGGG
jgi:hypothetical protein